MSGQALVFVVRTQDWSFKARAAGLTYAAFLIAQVHISLPPSHPCAAVTDQLGRAEQRKLALLLYYKTRERK